MDKIAWDVLNVAYKLLLTSQDAKTPEERRRCLNIALELGNSDRPHNHVICISEAKSFRLNIDDSVQNRTLLTLYKEWVSDKLNEKSLSHIIDIYYPRKVKKVGRKNGKEERKTS